MPGRRRDAGLGSTPGAAPRGARPGLPRYTYATPRPTRHRRGAEHHTPHRTRHPAAGPKPRRTPCDPDVGSVSTLDTRHARTRLLNSIGPDESRRNARRRPACSAHVPTTHTHTHIRRVRRRRPATTRGVPRRRRRRARAASALPLPHDINGGHTRAVTPTTPPPTRPTPPPDALRPSQSRRPPESICRMKMKMLMKSR